MADKTEREDEDVFHEFYGGRVGWRLDPFSSVQLTCNDPENCGVTHWHEVNAGQCIIRGVSPQPVPLPRGQLEMLADEVAALKQEVERQRVEIERVYLCPLCRAGNKVDE
jgi:hypothetical protein